jgi:hypothetical protein
MVFWKQQDPNTKHILPGTFFNLKIIAEKYFFIYRDLPIIL